MSICRPVGKNIVLGPGCESRPIILLTSLKLANVPRDMTASFPRLEPYELKSLGTRPLSDRYLAAGLLRAILPAGDI